VQYGYFLKILDLKFFKFSKFLFFIFYFLFFSPTVGFLFRSGSPRPSVLRFDFIEQFHSVNNVQQYSFLSRIFNFWSISLFFFQFWE